MLQRWNGFNDETGLASAFCRDVIDGLSQRQRSIPARWFYDRAGSELFEEITKLPEYYLTSAERDLLSAIAGEISSFAGTGRAVVEFGSGSSCKTPVLLSALKAAAYVPIDISREFLWESAAKLSKRFEGLPIYPLDSDFTEPFALPSEIEQLPRIAFFPGSTIGNFLAPDAVNLLRGMARTLGPGSLLLIGIDRLKDPQTLISAYDDSKGVTAAFNLNLLYRINRELDASIPVDAFSHLALWNDAEARIEMHLQAIRDVFFKVSGKAFSICQGETIHTENSLKYGSRDASVLLKAGHWNPIANWTDRRELVSLILAETE